MNVLEVGCGRRKLLKKSVGIDIQKLKGITVQADARHLPFKDRCFDLCLCFEVLEHTPNPNKALAEICRVTKEAVLITTPHKIAILYRLLHRQKPFHYERYLSLKDIKIPKGWELVWRRAIWYQQIYLKRKSERQNE